MSDLSTTIRVSQATHAAIKPLAAAYGDSITAVVDRAVKDLERKKFWSDFHEACLETQGADQAALRAKDAVYEGTIVDGI